MMLNRRLWHHICTHNYGKLDLSGFADRIKKGFRTERRVIVSN